MLHRPIFALILTAFLQPLAAQTIQVNRDNKTIAITATDSAETEADTADITIGFTQYGTAQDQTYADASRVSNQIVKSLTDAGLKREQIRSNQQQLNQLGADNFSDKARYDQGLRFFFSQHWIVTASAAQAADILHLAVLAGANDSGNIDWRLADDNALEAQAAAKALTHAQQIAERMAGGLHAKLGPLVYASNQLPQRNFYGGRLQTESAMAGTVEHKNLKPLAIVPDKVTRSATVYAVFSIE